jgi:hypothetical protein
MNLKRREFLRGALALAVAPSFPNVESIDWIIRIRTAYTDWSHTWENEILDHLFGKGSYTPPTIYVALSTADPTDAGTGIAQPSGEGTLYEPKDIRVIPC